MNQSIATQLVRISEGHIRDWTDTPFVTSTYRLFNLSVVDRLLEKLHIELGKR